MKHGSIGGWCALALASLSIACQPGMEGPTARPTSTCPAPALGRLLIEELVSETMVSAVWMGRHSGPDTRGYAHSVLGAMRPQRGAVVAAECSAPLSLGPVCREAHGNRPGAVDDFWSRRDRCLRLHCEEAGVAVVETYYTMQPQTQSSEAHTFAYEAITPSASVRYEPNPLVRWRIDLRDPVLTTITGWLDEHVTVTPPGATPLRMDHEGVVRATQLPGGDVAVTLELDLPHLAATAPIEIYASRSNAGVTIGHVRQGAEILATFGGTDRLRFRWVASCLE